MSDVYIKIQASGGGGTTPVGATWMKTGQTTSYRTGDDGDLEEGRATDFTTLAVNNPFGNTNRFTDELGGSTYANDIVIDWSTYDTVAGTVLGIDRNFITAFNTWDSQIDAALVHSVGTFTTGWRLPNIKEVMNFAWWGSTQRYNYSPLNVTSVNVWTSTSLDANYAFPFASVGNTPVYRYLKTNGRNSCYVRTFTVTGTTLT